MKYLILILSLSLIVGVVIGAPASKSKNSKNPKNPITPKTNVISGFNVTLAWCPSTNVAGYRLYYNSTITNNPNWTSDVYDTTNCPSVLITSGTNWLRTYGFSTNVGNVTTYQLANLSPGRTWYFTATAFDTNDLESDFSNEVRKYIPPSNTITNFDLSISFVPGGGMSLQANIYPYQPYTIYYKDSFADTAWKCLVSSTSDSVGRVVYIDFSSTTNTMRFYKISVLL